MKKLQSLQALALTGVAITFMATGCSSTSSNRAETGSTDELAAYRMSSAFGSVPITSIHMYNKFPLDWGPVAYESYTFHVPVADQTAVDVGSAPSFETNLQPGDAFVEAAGSDGTSQVKRVIRYTPFGGGSGTGTGGSIR